MTIRNIVVAAAFALAACTPAAQSTATASSGKPPEPASAQTTAPAATGKPAEPAPVQTHASAASAPAPVTDSGKPGAADVSASADAITPQFLYGRWGDNGDCTKDVVLGQDGTFQSYTGGVGHWRLTGHTLVMSGDNGDRPLDVQFIDQNHVRLRNPDGSVGTSQRC